MKIVNTTVHFQGWKTLCPLKEAVGRRIVLCSCLGTCRQRYATWAGRLDTEDVLHCWNIKAETERCRQTWCMTTSRKLHLWIQAVFRNWAAAWRGGGLSAGSTHISRCQLVLYRQNTLMELVGILIEEIRFGGSDAARFLQLLSTDTIFCELVSSSLVFFSVLGGYSCSVGPQLWSQEESFKPWREKLLKGQDIPQFDKGSV